MRIAKKKSWHKQEKRIATELGGRLTPASGAGPIKGDVQTDDYIIEAKTTTKKSYAVTTTTLKKLEQQSHLQSKKPALFIQFEESPLMNSEWVLIPREDFHARDI